MEKPVLFLDSGAGGLPYARHFLDANPGERIVYLADREHYPYGGKSREELSALLLRLAGELAAMYDPKLAVLACNTASVSALDALREAFPGIPWVGTVPAVKPAVLESRARRIGVLGTRRTVEDPCIDDLARRYGPDCAIIRAAAPDLVDFVENGGDMAGEEEQRRAVAPYIKDFRQRGADGIVLGCTHFLFLLKAFRAETARSGAEPGIGIYESVEGVSRRASDILAERGLRAAFPEEAGKHQRPGNILVLTGSAPPGPRWHSRARAFGLELETLP